MEALEAAGAGPAPWHGGAFSPPCLGPSLAQLAQPHPEPAGAVWRLSCEVGSRAERRRSREPRRGGWAALAVPPEPALPTGPGLRGSVRCFWAVPCGQEAAGIQPRCRRDSTLWLAQGHVPREGDGALEFPPCSATRSPDVSAPAALPRDCATARGSVGRAAVSGWVGRACPGGAQRCPVLRQPRACAPLSGFRISGEAQEETGGLPQGKGEPHRHVSGQRPGEGGGAVLRTLGLLAVPVRRSTAQGRGVAPSAPRCPPDSRDGFPCTAAPRAPQTLTREAGNACWFARHTSSSLDFYAKRGKGGLWGSGRPWALQRGGLRPPAGTVGTGLGGDSGRVWGSRRGGAKGKEQGQLGVPGAATLGTGPCRGPHLKDRPHLAGSDARACRAAQTLLCPIIHIIVFVFPKSL